MSQCMCDVHPREHYRRECLTPTVSRIRWLCYAVGHILLTWFGSTCPLRGTSVQICSSDHLFPMMKHFHPDGSSLFQDDNALIHKALGVTK